MIDNDPTVLVVEDEFLLALTLEEGLQDAGYAVVLAHTGDEAIKLLEAEPYRFIGLITDIRMPGKKNGWDVGRRARELRAGIPVIYASGDGAPDWRRFGVVDSIMLPKPLYGDRQLQMGLTSAPSGAFKYRRSILAGPFARRGSRANPVHLIFGQGICTCSMIPLAADTDPEDETILQRRLY